MINPSTLTDDELRKAYPTVNWEKADMERARFVLGKFYEMLNRPVATRQEMTKNG